MEGIIEDHQVVREHGGFRVIEKCENPLPISPGEKRSEFYKKFTAQINSFLFKELDLPPAVEHKKYRAAVSHLRIFPGAAFAQVRRVNRKSSTGFHDQLYLIKYHRSENGGVFQFDSPIPVIHTAFFTEGFQSLEKPSSGFWAGFF